ncbi:hypothetical protein [Ralstonia sp. ASV6]|uniref:hypothetical protein n=1 Tax=Ralstonia sp. ASV6 TaxID=2795124 RepID=UPI0018EE03FB|nr:hypothetical protein [Ralstonia sp. ASV6]
MHRYLIYTAPGQSHPRFATRWLFVASLIATYRCAFLPYCRIDDAVLGKTLFLDDGAVAGSR